MKRAGLLIPITLVLFAVLGVAFRPTWKRWYIDHSLKKFQANPDGATAAVLVGALREGEVDAKKGGVILQALMRPQILLRENYPAGKTVRVLLSRPLAIEWQGFTSSHTVRSFALEKSAGIGGGGSGTSPPTRLLHMAYFDRGVASDGSVRNVDKPGEYTGRVDIEYSVTSNYSRRRGGAGPPYQCHFSIDVRFKVVEPEEAEQVALTTNPALDSAVRAAIAVTPCGGSFGTGNTGKLSLRNSIELRGSRLPIDVAFRASYADESGRSIPLEQVVRGRKGEDFTIVPLQLHSVLTAGTPVGAYQGKIILTPAPDVAYNDSMAKEIWGGTLEYPISFSIK